jgi:hypothetical protein
MEHRRSWTVELDGYRHRIDVVYGALVGWLSIEIDGRRVARGWREWQTVFGGATLACDFRRHRIEARVTQPWLRQEYSFGLRIDGEVQPGSDLQPPASTLRRGTLLAILAALVTGILISFILNLLRIL